VEELDEDADDEDVERVAIEDEPGMRKPPRGWVAAAGARARDVAASPTGGGRN
jgi:hypothetical protein